MKLVLGSSSVFRKEILEKHGYEFTTASPDIDEKSLGEEYRATNDAEKLVLLLAHKKADALQDTFPDSILVCSDQVIVHQGVIREKPINATQCKEYLQSYATAPAESYTAIVVVNTKTKKRVGKVDIAKQYFKPIPEDIIDEAIKEGMVMKSAGGFMVEHPLFSNYLDKRVGDITSIMGLCIPLMQELINQVI